MSERTFTIRDACAATGLTACCLHQWIERGHFQPLHEARSGVSRDYTLRDIVHLAAMVELGAAGFPAAQAAQILGASPSDTSGRRKIVARRGATEVSVNIEAIADRIRKALS